VQHRGTQGKRTEAVCVQGKGLTGGDRKGRGEFGVVRGKHSLKPEPDGAPCSRRDLGGTTRKKRGTIVWKFAGRGKVTGALTREAGGESGPKKKKDVYSWKKP